MNRSKSCGRQLRMHKIIVLGSVNMDFVIHTNRMPLAGESLIGHGSICNQGGKGANQAVACKKLGGGEVVFLGAVGKDENGKKLIASLERYGVDVSHVLVKKEKSSGVCFIIIDEAHAENYLIVDTGANECVSSEAVSAYIRATAQYGDVFLSQLEINLDAVTRGLQEAHKRGMFTILNPAPAQKIEKDVLNYVDLLVMNETEAEFFSGVAVRELCDAERVHRYFSEFGVRETVITLGSKGCFYVGDIVTHCPAKKIVAIDPTSAGDTFIGALALRKAQGYSVLSSLQFANLCSALTVSRAGASESIPTAEEVYCFSSNE